MNKNLDKIKSKINLCQSILNELKRDIENEKKKREKYIKEKSNGKIKSKKYSDFNISKEKLQRKTILIRELSSKIDKIIENELTTYGYHVLREIDEVIDNG